MFVKLWLSDLLVAIGTVGVVSVVVATQVRTRGLGLLVSLACGFALYMLTAPLVYRWFRLRPMHYPTCPHCGAREGPWGIQNIQAPSSKEHLLCGHCGELVEFWYRKPPMSEMSGTMPAFELRWPQHFGRWRLVKPVGAV